MKEVVLTMVSEDSLWYGRIIIERLWAFLSETTPVSIQVWKYSLQVQIHGLMALAGALFVAHITRRAYLVKL